MTQLAQSSAEHEKQLATAGDEDLQPVQEGPLVARIYSISKQLSRNQITTCGVGTGVSRRRHKHGARLVVIVILQGDYGGQLGAGAGGHGLGG